MSLATEIKAARAQLGLSQAEAAEMWKVNVRSLQRWERDQNPPKGLALDMLRQRISESVSEQSQVAMPTPSEGTVVVPRKQRTSKPRKLAD